MYTIGEISKLTGITAFTIRYYEKIGVLPPSRRQYGKPDGIRRYDDDDLRFIRFVHGLKQTGMTLEDIAAFTEDGCLLQNELGYEMTSTLQKRMEILDRHMEQVEQQVNRLQTVRELAKEKRSYYAALLKEQDSNWENTKA